MEKRRLPATLQTNRSDLQVLNERANLIKIIKNRDNNIEKRKELMGEYNEIMKRLYKSQQKKKARLRAGRGGVRTSRSWDKRNQERYKRGERREEGEDESKIIGEEIKKDALGNIQITYRDIEKDNAEKLRLENRADRILLEDRQLRVDEQDNNLAYQEERDRENRNIQREFRDRDEQYREFKLDMNDRGARTKRQTDRLYQDAKLNLLEQKLEQGDDVFNALQNLDTKFSNMFNAATEQYKNLIVTNPNSIELYDLKQSNPKIGNTSDTGATDLPGIVLGTSEPDDEEDSPNPKINSPSLTPLVASDFEGFEDMLNSVTKPDPVVTYENPIDTFVKLEKQKTIDSLVPGSQYTSLEGDEVGFVNPLNTEDEKSALEIENAKSGLFTVGSAGAKDAGIVQSPKPTPKKVKLPPVINSDKYIPGKFEKDQEVMYFRKGVDEAEGAWRPAKIVDYKSDQAGEAQLSIQRLDKKDSEVIDTLHSRVIPVPNTGEKLQQLELREKLKDGVLDEGETAKKSKKGAQWSDRDKYIIHNNTDFEFRGIAPRGKSVLNYHKASAQHYGEHSYYHTPLDSDDGWMEKKGQQRTIHHKYLLPSLETGILRLEKLDEKQPFKKGKAPPVLPVGGQPISKGFEVGEPEAEDLGEGVGL